MCVTVSYSIGELIASISIVENDNFDYHISNINADNFHTKLLNAYRKFNATQFDVQCMDDAASESKQLKVQQIDSVKTSEIYQISSGNANAIILWFINGEIESRRYDTQNHQIHSDQKQFNQITSVSTESFGQNSLVAICWHMYATHRPNTIIAVASIYR